jgi:hypothetical protein
MGGNYHDQLFTLALAGSLSLLFFFAFLAWNGVGAVVDGSVLAARLSERLPGFGSILGAAAFFYGAAEFVEPHHAAASGIAVAFSLAAASWLVRRISRIALAVLAGAIAAVFGTSFAPRTPAWSLLSPPAPHVARVFRRARRFARPPPPSIVFS